MDTLIIITVLAGLISCLRRPNRKWALILFSIALLANITLFCLHISTHLDLSF